MKKKIVCLMTVMLCLSMAGCAKTPEKALVAQKNIERLEDAAKQTPKEGTTLKDRVETTTSTYSFNYKSEDGRVTIDADNVPVTLPKKDAIPMYHVKGGEISQNLTDKIYDYFFPNGAYSETGTDVTKAVMDERILEVKQAIANYQDDTEITDEERESIIQQQKELLEFLEQEKKEAPEKSTLKLEPKDSKYVDREYETINGKTKIKELDVCSDDNKQRLFVSSCNDSSSVIPSGITYEGDGEYEYEYDYSDNNRTPVALCSEKDKEAIGISEEEARKYVNDFVKTIGMNWEIHDILCVRGSHCKVVENKDEQYEEIIEPDHDTAYQFILSQSIDGIQSAVTSSCYLPDDDDTSITWLYESISIIVEPKGIVYVQWDYPLQVEDCVSDNVGIISFDDAKDIFEQMMPLTTKGNLEEQSDDNEEVSAKVTVSDVRLGFMRVRSSGEDKTGLMTPVWIFYGDYTRTTHYTKNAEELGFELNDFSFTEPAPWILLAVNAVDGSVIDITAGY